MILNKQAKNKLMKRDSARAETFGWGAKPYDSFNLVYSNVAWNRASRRQALW
jgi:hypothetical protein